MATLQLPPRCDRAAVAALLPEFRAAQGDEPLRIDGSACQQAGQALLQLLLSARRTGAGAVIAASGALRETARMAGLEAALLEGGEA